MGNLVAIVGRPNVGKSTLFNRLTKSRRAIVSDTAGTTRDRQYGKCEWNGREFSVVDTGGWVVKSDDIFEEAIRQQVLIATEEADLVLFLVDVKSGLTDWDEDVAVILRQTKLPVILVANKVDNNTDQYDAMEFYSSVWATRSASVRPGLWHRRFARPGALEVEHRRGGRHRGRYSPLCRSGPTQCR